MDKALPTQPIPASQLLARRRTHFTFAPDAEARAAIAVVLDLIELPQLHFEGEIAPDGDGGLTLEGALKADPVQACVVTLAPVPTQIAEQVARHYVADWEEPTGEEVEIPDDDTIEPLPHAVDVAAVAIEALALALPDYPRAPGARLAPIEDADAEDAAETRRPLAGLADLMARKDGNE